MDLVKRYFNKMKIDNANLKQYVMLELQSKTLKNDFSKRYFSAGKF